MGSGVVEQLSFDLQAAFPNEKGFGSRNLWHMKQWYLFYAEKLKQGVAELIISEEPQEDKKLKQFVSVLSDEGEEVDFPRWFSFVSLGHHIEIVKKCKDISSACFQRRDDTAWRRVLHECSIKGGS